MSLSGTLRVMMAIWPRVSRVTLSLSLSGEEEDIVAVLGFGMDGWRDGGIVRVRWEEEIWGIEVRIGRKEGQLVMTGLI